MHGERNTPIPYYMNTINNRNKVTLVSPSHCNSLLSFGLEHTVPNLWCNVGDCSRAMGDEHGVGLGGGANLTHGVEVLGHEDHVHHVLCGGAWHIVWEGQHAVPQPVHNGLALPRDTQPCQILGFCVSLSTLDLQYLLSLRLLIGGQPQPSSCCQRKKEKREQIIRQFWMKGTPVTQFWCFFIFAYQVNISSDILECPWLELSAKFIIRWIRSAAVMVHERRFPV